MAIERTTRGKPTEQMDRLAMLRYEAELLQEEYKATFRDRTLPDLEQIAALAALAGEMRAVLTEAQWLIYG